MSHSEEAQKITLDKFIKAFSDFSAEGQLACFPDDYKQRTLPLSLGIPGRGKKEAAHALPKLEEAVKNVKVEVNHVVHDPARRKASIYAVATGDTEFGDFHNEYACFLDFSEDGEKIVRNDEFMDSAFLMRFYPSFSKYLAEHP